ncbi:UPF0175 family protein [Halobellus clavatus]|jgi:predicted HTH domain antitoxin|uniref:Uncharacterized protein family (UPF0175) n=2 Tax=Halobellus clavatus TaxID=660517 RepID=A0A1H3EDH6_9EURY|nr:UPF0175 family protein [Halobellus clavatus]SDX76677.1 Uncharacterised protein family (UPF0175) [Halobellus clavatus]
MYTHGLNTAMTLYQNGTLSLSQAAAHAGRSPDAFVTALERHGITVRENQFRSGTADGATHAD